MRVSLPKKSRKQEPPRGQIIQNQVHCNLLNINLSSQIIVYRKRSKSRNNLQLKERSRSRSGIKLTNRRNHVSRDKEDMGLHRPIPDDYARQAGTAGICDGKLNVYSNKEQGIQNREWAYDRKQSKNKTMLKNIYTNQQARQIIKSPSSKKIDPNTIQNLAKKEQNINKNYYKIQGDKKQATQMGLTKDHTLSIPMSQSAKQIQYCYQPPVGCFASRQQTHDYRVYKGNFIKRLADHQNNEQKNQIGINSRNSSKNSRYETYCPNTNQSSRQLAYQQPKSRQRDSINYSSMEISTQDITRMQGKVYNNSNNNSNKRIKDMIQANSRGNTYTPSQSYSKIDITNVDYGSISMQASRQNLYQIQNAKNNNSLKRLKNLFNMKKSNINNTSTDISYMNNKSEMISRNTMPQNTDNNYTYTNMVQNRSNNTSKMKLRPSNNQLESNISRDSINMTPNPMRYTDVYSNRPASRQGHYYGSSNSLSIGGIGNIGTGNPNINNNNDSFSRTLSNIENPPTPNNYPNTSSYMTINNTYKPNYPSNINLTTNPNKYSYTNLLLNSHKKYNQRTNNNNDNDNVLNMNKKSTIIPNNYCADTSNAPHLTFSNDLRENVSTHVENDTYYIRAHTPTYKHDNQILQTNPSSYPTPTNTSMIINSLPSSSLEANSREVYTNLSLNINKGTNMGDSPGIIKNQSLKNISKQSAKDMDHQKSSKLMDSTKISKNQLPTGLQSIPNMLFPQSLHHSSMKPQGHTTSTARNMSTQNSQVLQLPRSQASSLNITTSRAPAKVCTYLKPKIHNLEDAREVDTVITGQDFTSRAVDFSYVEMDRDEAGDRSLRLEKDMSENQSVRVLGQSTVIANNMLQQGFWN